MKTLLAFALFFLTTNCIGQVAGVSGACSAAHAVASGLVSSETLTCTPNAANHALVIAGSCFGTSETAPSIVASPATGWTFTSLVALVGTNGSTGWKAEWGTITPNTTSTTFTITWPGSGCGSGSVMAGEFSGNDTTGGTTTFYGTPGSNKGTTGGCSGAAMTSTSANDALWASCDDSLPTTSWQGSGFTAGVQDSDGDATEYKVATGTITPTWTSTSAGFNITSALIKAAGGAVAATMPAAVY